MREPAQLQNQSEQNLTLVNQVIGVLSSDTRDLPKYSRNALIYGLSAGMGLMITTLNCQRMHPSTYLPGYSPKDFNATLSMELRQECNEQQFGFFTAGSLFLLIGAKSIYEACNSSRQNPSNHISLFRGILGLPNEQEEREDREV
jgi:hypothetical protein